MFVYVCCLSTSFFHFLFSSFHASLDRECVFYLITYSLFVCPNVHLSCLSLFFLRLCLSQCFLGPCYFLSAYKFLFYYASVFHSIFLDTAEQRYPHLIRRFPTEKSSIFNAKVTYGTKIISYCCSGPNLSELLGAYSPIS